MRNAEKLTIYKASAGSGKTFQLTKEYLSILFKNPAAYKNILAVTFTNKATAEMKGRILNELSKIANEQPSDYAGEFQKSLKYSKEVLVSKAKLILNNILHDYSRFTIETIDNFFQRVLKSFTKELHIYFNYNLELDTPKIIEQAASQMVFNSHENRELREWLSEFALEKISQGKTWNAKRDIVFLGNELFNEQFQLTFDKINEEGNDKETLRNYIAACNQVIEDFENYLAEIGEKALSSIQNNGFSVEDFTQKSKGVAGYFEKLAQKKDSAPNTYVIKASIDFDNWIPKKSSKKEEIFKLYDDCLKQLLDSALHFVEENSEKYESAKSILKLIYAFGILTDLYSHVRTITNEQNIFLLADTGKLIHTVIENNDAPFIYEKLGSLYTHFMIDEFQDTSELQWMNFFPLIQNSLALGNKNIVVGDVKQAIYRWRNSNWNILGNKIYNQVPSSQLETINLEKNWRSNKNIIQFNNSLYKQLSEDLQHIFNSEMDEFLTDNPFSGTIKSAYNELKQELPTNKIIEDGYVNIKLVDDEDWEEQILKELPNIIIELLNKGFEQSQITLLVRNRREGQAVIDKLIEGSKKILAETGIQPNFLSSDALLLKSSKTVRCVLSALRYIVSKEDKINKAYLTTLIYEALNQGPVFLHEKEEEGQEPLSWLNSNEHGVNQYSLYNLVSEIIKKFNLDSFNEKSFVVSFLDIVLDFSRNHHTGIKSFLDWWDEHGDKLSLNVEEADNAIQVLTIHKSKGLEFDAVIIPFCNWQIDQHVSHANIMWCAPKTGPFNEVPVVPVTYSNKLSKTNFKSEYAFEKLNTYIDNINLLYVATTRAKQVLIIRSPHPDQIKRNGLTCSRLLLNTFKSVSPIQEQDFINIPQRFLEEENIFEVGKLENSTKQKQKKQNSLDVSLSDKPGIVGDMLNVKYNHKDYMSSGISTSLINEGKLLHKIFERIIYIDDVNNAVDEAYMSGLIPNGEKAQMVKSITELINNSLAKEWFDKKWQVKTEAEILLPNGIQKRPDRVLFGEEKVVVIDYKFGLQEINKHLQQVEEYVKLMKNMNYSKVEGFVWYVALNKISKV